MEFVKADAGPPAAGDPRGSFSVRYYDSDGNLTIRSGGTRAWRCNNPGNLLKSPYSMSKHRRSIGYAGDGKHWYPVYPDRDTGLEALTVLLKGSVYSPLSLRAALKRYEPGKIDYIDIVAARTGLDPERTINSLSDGEFNKFQEAIQHVEKWDIGREDFIERWVVAGVHKKHGTIVEYCIQKPPGATWIDKAAAVALANEGRLRAVLVKHPNGTQYLRPEYRHPPFELVT